MKTMFLALVFAHSLGGHYSLNLTYDESRVSEDGLLAMQELQNFTAFLLPTDKRTLRAGTYSTSDATEFLLVASDDWKVWDGELDTGTTKVTLHLTGQEDDPFEGDFIADVGGERIRGTYTLPVGW